jgi:hypothetical protein
MTVYAPHFVKISDRLWSLDTVNAINIGFTYPATWRYEGAQIAAAALSVYGKTIIKTQSQRIGRRHGDFNEIFIEFETDEDEAFFILQVPNIKFTVSY